MELISVIVPVYKVEPYLDKCIQSIVDQTYKNLEIILVDDGSPDKCGTICDEWAAKDSRIRVIHKENGGVSTARNAGIASATGEYLCFVDSDDAIDPQFAYLLYCAAKEANADVAVCEMCRIPAGEAIPSAYCGTPEIGSYSTEDALTSLIEGGIFKGGPCDKLYHKSLIAGAEFPVGFRHEDEFFTHRVLIRAKRLAYVNAPLYIYFQCKESFMHSFSVHHLDMLEASLERLELVRNIYPKLYKKGKAAFCVSCVSNYRAVLDASARERKRFAYEIRNYRKRIRFGLSELLTYSPKQILYIAASKLCLVPFAQILNFRKGVE